MSSHLCVNGVARLRASRSCIQRDARAATLAAQGKAVYDQPIKRFGNHVMMLGKIDMKIKVPIKGMKNGRIAFTIV